MNMLTPAQVNFRIPVQNMPHFTERMDKLTKKAASLGFADEVGFVELHEDVVTDAKGRVQRFMNVVVFGTTPQMSGYSYIASIEHTREGLVFVREAHGQFLPAELRELGPVCHHCFQNRFRKNTFILKNQTGAYVSVGSTCINDFTGNNKSPTQIASWMEQATGLKELETVPADDKEGGVERWGINYPVEYNLRTALAACAIDMEQRGGYVKYFEGGPTTTAEMAACAIGMYHHPKHGVAQNIEPILADDAAAEPYFIKAEEAIEWAKNLSDTAVAATSYLYNIRTIARLGYVTYRSLRMAASMVTAHNRSKPKTVAAVAVKKPSEYVGTAGERIDRIVSVMSITPVCGYSYNNNQVMKDLVVMEDTDGNKLTWFCDGKNPFKKGDTHILVKLTVKAHEDFKGTKQTKVNRVVVVS